VEQRRVGILLAIVGAVAALWLAGVFGVISFGIGQWFQDSGPDNDEWRITLDDEAVGIHTISMVKTFTPPAMDEFTDSAAQDLSGRPVWDETEVALCTIDVRYASSKPLIQVGATFSTGEKCDIDTGMQDAFDDFGLPTKCACQSCGQPARPTNTAIHLPLTDPQQRTHQ
jgi:hypothetical protein